MQKHLKINHRRESVQSTQILTKRKQLQESGGSRV